MESIAKHVQEIQYLERKRRATLRPFIGVMYISFAVFLVTVYLLISSFFKQLANTTFGGSSAIGGVGFSFISLPLPKITAVFLYMAMIEALFAGLVGGKMATGYLKDGLKHAILLMLICFVTFVSSSKSTIHLLARMLGSHLRQRLVTLTVSLGQMPLKAFQALFSARWTRSQISWAVAYAYTIYVALSAIPPFKAQAYSP